MPTTNEGRAFYRKMFNALLKSRPFSIKFPGEPIFGGYNTLFAYYKEIGSYIGSGILPLQSDFKSFDGKTLDRGPILKQSTLSDMFSTSIYPTKEEALASYEKDPSFRKYELQFHSFLTDIDMGGGTYRIAKPSNENPVVLIQLGCRSADFGHNRRRGSPMRMASTGRNANVMQTLTKEELVDPEATKLGTLLMYYITYRQVERVEQYLKQLERVMPTALERSAFFEKKIMRYGDTASAMDIARQGFEENEDTSSSFHFNIEYEGPSDQNIQKIRERLEASARDDGGYTKVGRKMAEKEEEEEHRTEMERIETKLDALPDQIARVQKILRSNPSNGFSEKDYFLTRLEQLMKRETDQREAKTKEIDRHRAVLAHIAEEFGDDEPVAGGARKERARKTRSRRSRGRNNRKNRKTHRNARRNQRGGGLKEDATEALTTYAASKGMTLDKAFLKILNSSYYEKRDPSYNTMGLTNPCAIGGFVFRTYGARDYVLEARPKTDADTPAALKAMNDDIARDLYPDKANDAKYVNISELNDR